jgi:hypothetical protein
MKPSDDAHINKGSELAQGTQLQKCSRPGAGSEPLPSFPLQGCIQIEAELEPAKIPEPNDESLLTPEDVARKFQVPITWVYGCVRGRCKRVIPHVKIGRYLRFEEPAVRRYLESNRRS